MKMLISMHGSAADLSLGLWHNYAKKQKFSS